jgi:hypothetical protein
MTELMRGQTCPAKGDQIPDVGEFDPVLPATLRPKKMALSRPNALRRLPLCRERVSSLPRASVSVARSAQSDPAGRFVILVEVRKRRAIF